MANKNVPRVCIQCGTNFLAYRSQINKGIGKFCSQKCHYDSVRGTKLSPELCLAISQALKGRKKSPLELQHLREAGLRKRRGFYKNCPLCNKEFYVCPSQQKIKFCSLTCARSGENNYFYGKRFVGKDSPSWKGGITPLILLIRNSDFYKEFKRKILERDNFRCTQCSSKNKLDLHHIASFSAMLRKYSIKTFKQAVEAVELWQEDNCVILCRECHKLTDNYAWKQILKKAITKVDRRSLEVRGNRLIINTSDSLFTEKCRIIAQKGKLKVCLAY